MPGCPRLSSKSLKIPKPARTAQVPVLVGFQASPTRGCHSALALFCARQEPPMCGLVWITKLAS